MAIKAICERLASPSDPCVGSPWRFDRRRDTRSAGASFSMIFTDSTFGLLNILPGALVGAGVGAILGFCFPRVGMVLVRLFSNL